MFDALSTPVQARAVTFDTVELATGLAWEQVNLNAPLIPKAPGVYVWVDAVPTLPLRYHGSGSGTNGLQRRLSDQLRWRGNQRKRLEVDPSSLSEQEAYDLSREVPAVQQAAGDRLLFCAVAEPASWSVERNEIAPPREARQWESFISAVSLHVTGHRGLIGGGAWESKGETIDHLMTDLAWDRLVDVNNGSWL